VAFSLVGKNKRKGDKKGERTALPFSGVHSSSPTGGEKEDEKLQGVYIYNQAGGGKEAWVQSSYRNSNYSRRSVAGEVGRGGD